MKLNRSSQSGASLIEVLIAVLILSFGMLALGGMMVYAIQAPKLAAYRATAVTQAGAYVERMRANKEGFAADRYLTPGSEPITYKVAFPAVYALTSCTYPSCTPQQIAEFDTRETLQTLRRELSVLSGMRVTCNGTCNSGEGDLWVIWDEPQQYGGLNFSSSDECPDPSAAPAFPAFTAPLPRCVHVRFKL